LPSFSVISVLAATVRISFGLSSPWKMECPSRCTFTQTGSVAISSTCTGSEPSGAASGTSGCGTPGWGAGAGTPAAGSAAGATVLAAAAAATDGGWTGALGC